MIYLFLGDDTEKKVTASQRLLKSLSKETEIIFINEGNFNHDQMVSLYSGRGLFFPKYTVVLQGIMENEELENFLLKNIERIAASENFFIFLEKKKTKSILDAFKKAGGDINIFEVDKEKTTVGQEKFNNFNLANAFSARDKLRLWIYFRQAMQAGVELEPLAGVLFWKAKDMILKKNFGKFSEAELMSLVDKLSYLIPEARREGRDAESAFEEFLLKV